MGFSVMARQIVRVPAAIASFLSHAVAVSSHAVRPLVVAGTLAACVATAALSLAAEGKPPRAEGAPVTISAGPDWLPLDVGLDIEPGSALDFSNVLPRHAPAGKFGRLIVTKQGKFAFENRAVPSGSMVSTCARTAQFLPRELADRLGRTPGAAGLQRGAHPSLRAMVGACACPGRIRFAADTLDQFDYLFAALKRRGIYVTTDLYVSRLVALADVYESASQRVPARPRLPRSAEHWTFENYYNVGARQLRRAGLQDGRVSSTTGRSTTSRPLPGAARAPNPYTGLPLRRRSSPGVAEPDERGLHPATSSTG